MNEVLPFRRQTYTARLVKIHASGLTITAAGTLDGFIDLCIQTSDGDHSTYQITPYDAAATITMLYAVIDDIRANCLYDKDPLLAPRDAE